MARNLIRRIISPNQDNLSYSIRISFPGSRNWVSCQTHSLWLNNAVQCRRLTGGSSIAAWTHGGTYLIYGFLACLFLLDQGIPVEYELGTFNTPHTGTTLRHPKNWLCRMQCRIPLRHLALVSPLGHIFTGPHASLQKKQKHKLTVTPKFISFNGKQDFR